MNLHVTTIIGSILALGMLSSCQNGSVLSRSSQPSSDPGYSYRSSGYRAAGIDVSDNVGSVDWSAVKGAGVVFAYAKASGGWSNSNWTYRDTEFSDNWPAMKQAGVARGAYHFFDLTASGTQQAEFFLKVLNQNGGLDAGDLPPVLDIEWTTSDDASMPPASLWQNEAIAWLNYVEEQTGRIPMIYTGASMAQNNFDSRFSRYPLWVAE